jgi:Lon protease-like protein
LTCATASPIFLGMAEYVDELPTFEHLQRLPLFPLPRLVFFPDTLLPLHVFEPRYRAMVRHCLDASWPLAVVLIEPGHEREQLGAPPIAPVAGVGRIAHHEVLPDGRMNIVLSGVARVGLDERASGAPYRVARASLRRDEWPESRHALDSPLSSLRSCLTALRLAWNEAPDGLLDWLLESPDASVLANRVSSALFTDPAEQELLACDNVAARLDAALDRVSLLLARNAGTDQLLH